MLIPLLLTLTLQAAGQQARPPGPTSDTLMHSPLQPCARSAAPARPQTIRIATWNIRAARSAPLEQIVAEIRDMGADLIALQEVDRDAARTGHVNQPQALADALGFQYAFAASIRVAGGDYGLAVLSRWPLASVVRHRLRRPRLGEPRIVLETIVCAAGRTLRLFDHHADTNAATRRANLAALRRLVARRGSGARVVLGDFNDTPDDPGVRALIESGFVDPAAGQDARTTAQGRIDYVLVDRALGAQVRRTEMWRSRNSDHNALVVDVGW